jgi:uroporphyrinogen decarboxylase
VQAILNHKEADQVPLDIGAGKACKINVDIYNRLLKHFDIKEETRVSNKAMRLVCASDKFLETLECDVRTPFPLFKKREKPIEEWDDPEGYFMRDDWGTVLRMPKTGGRYYDMIEAPFAGRLDDDEVPFKFPAAQAVAPEAVAMAKAYQEAGYPVIIPEHYGNGFLQTGPKVFGYEDWMIMLAVEDKKAIQFMDELFEKKLEHWDNIISAFGDSIDVVAECDDLGTQNGPFIDPAMFRKLMKPYYRKLYDHIHRKSKAKILLHSCGSVIKMIPDLIDVGLDVLNPVQINASEMDPAILKREYGKDLTFWGGGVDTQRVLPMGSKQEIRDHVKRNIEIFSKDGGFVFATVHNLQSDVPTDNFLTMWETFKECRKY